ncbi:toll/interleukin-1 receptor domain-containing protein [Bradyrhizobium sp. ARR65]|uniref:toll/interleukin-1 receptor domain-containing protein n=1 Tax=Bradyrhizobium sp. ARR65 TaxID=1040989 RepID=UPI0004660591|nr:toll/interleukin-1 receptor domain-containing protein [Bradyrhizobium sp. ARR65]
MPGNGPLIFVSHADEDREVAILLKSLITRASGGRARVYVSSDISAKRFGENWFRRIRENLSEAKAVIFLASPNSLKASWALLEIGGALFNTDRPKIIPICIAGLTIPELIDPLTGLDASEPSDVVRLQSVVRSVLERCRIPAKLRPTLDWASEYIAFRDAQEEWVTIDHRIYSACSVNTLRHLEPVLQLARSGQNDESRYQELIGHLLQKMTFHGSPIDDRFWAVHGNDIRERRDWVLQRKLAYLVSAAKEGKIVTARKDSYAVMDVLRQQVSEYRATATDEELQRPESQKFLFGSASPSIFRLFILRKGAEAMSGFTKEQKKALDDQVLSGVEVRFLRWEEEAAPPNFGLYGNVAVGQLAPNGVNEILFSADAVKNRRNQFETLWQRGDKL